ncbi:hypothetical protein [Legionella micdadei]|uniref:Uncharacterized protein n=1 Tax=Legionella micdadei TaxID=451 RepID=A0A098GHR4_LEGMI|nr:hypothetical protein [Legionella micdadei]ARG97490.1 hypothetical protein B6N58_07325 [Legionella micdadei]KTD28387.1 hypothetical protein Lmic_1498 [Legionella micdadei]NSL17014.1 hypothetical protein [Legionella micdadei]CEG61021.1 protein of unknown function [Legionella micdadei]SCY70568.1 hypothetical protein SAMN02982997_02589 [Legionella micdadei]
MFKDIHQYLLETKAQLTKEHANTSLQTLKDAASQAYKDFEKLAKDFNKGVYSNPELIKLQINYLLLQELYCRKLLPNDEHNVKEWFKLENAYQKLEHMLREGRHQTLRIEQGKTDPKKISSEMSALDSYIQQKGLQGNVSETEFYANAGSTEREFLEVMLEVKKQHIQVSLDESEFSNQYYTDRSNNLETQLRGKLKTLNEEIDGLQALKEEKKRQTPLSILEKWGLEDHYKQANPFKLLVLWFNNKFLSSEPIQSLALAHDKANSDLDLSLSMTSNRISNLETELGQLRKVYGQSNGQITLAENRHKTALKLITPEHEENVQQLESDISQRMQ